MSLCERSEEYLKDLVGRNFSPLTVKNRRSHLRRFLGYLERHGVSGPAALRREHIEDFLDELTWEPTHRGVPMQVESRNVRLVSVRGFVRWLFEHDYAATDVSRLVGLAREPLLLPRHVPDETAVRKLLAAPDGRTALGFRDRAILELLYSSGMRVGELVALDVSDVDLESRYVFIRRGKGGKDRVVPLGKQAGATLASFLAGARPELTGDDEKALLVNYRGARLSTAAVERLVLAYGAAAGLGRVTPHGLRHACATHMVRRGAPLRHVQELLGHAAITTTEIYTRLTQQELLAAHARFHPREQEPLP